MWGMSWFLTDKDINDEVNGEFSDVPAMSGNSADINKEIPTMEKRSRPSSSSFPKLGADGVPAHSTHAC